MGRRFAVLSLTFLLTPALFGQEFRGTITGRVIDAQGAGIPGARIVAILTSTGGQSVTNTGGDGLYTIPFLTPGAYKIEAEASGFVSTSGKT